MAPKPEGKIKKAGSSLGKTHKSICFWNLIINVMDSRKHDQSLCLDFYILKTLKCIILYTEKLLFSLHFNIYTI